MVFDKHFLGYDRRKLGLQNDYFAELVIVKLLCTVLNGSLTNRFKINFFHKTIPPFAFQYITLDGGGATKIKKARREDERQY